MGRLTEVLEADDGAELGQERGLAAEHISLEIAITAQYFSVSQEYNV